MELNYASRGVGNAGLTTGIIGTSLGALGIGGAVLNAVSNKCAGKNMAHQSMPMIIESGGAADHPVSRYELGLEQSNAAKDSEIALLKANIYNDQKALELYRYIDGKLGVIDAAIAAQNVRNQAVQDSFQLAEERRACGEKELHAAIMRECEARKCADNTLVNYMNATFYPKQVADVTVGTTSTPQTLYNPLPVSTCGSGCGC